MDRSRHTVTKDFSDIKTHGGLINKTFKRLGYINDQLYEVQLVKSEIEQKGPIIVEFFSFCSMQSLECYSCNITSLTSIAIIKRLESWRRVLFRFFHH